MYILGSGTFYILKKRAQVGLVFVNNKWHGDTFLMISAGGEQNPSVGAAGLCQLFFHLLDRFVKLLIGSKVDLALLNLP